MKTFEEWFAQEYGATFESFVETDHYDFEAIDIKEAWEAALNNLKGGPFLDAEGINTKDDHFWDENK